MCEKGRRSIGKNGQRRAKKEAPSLEVRGAEVLQVSTTIYCIHISRAMKGRPNG
jgi:hypothetical protein